MDDEKRERERETERRREREREIKSAKAIKSGRETLSS